MLTLYRTDNCPDCDSLEQALTDLVVAHHVVVVEGGSDAALGMAPLPVLMDREDRVRGHKAILQHLDELERFKALWDKFQTDACYCDEEGRVE